MGPYRVLVDRPKSLGYLRLPEVHDIVPALRSDSLAQAFRRTTVEDGAAGCRDQNRRKQQDRLHRGHIRSPCKTRRSLPAPGRRENAAGAGGHLSTVRYHSVIPRTAKHLVLRSSAACASPEERPRWPEIIHIERAAPGQRGISQGLICTLTGWCYISSTWQALPKI